MLRFDRWLTFVVLTSLPISTFAADPLFVECSSQAGIAVEHEPGLEGVGEILITFPKISIPA